jgi:hypothetical protein
VSFSSLLFLLVQATPVEPHDGTNAYIAEANRTLSVTRRCDPAAAADDIVVCGRRTSPERYRLPIRPEGFDKKGPIDSVSRERHRLIQEGDAGIGSCSAVGASGSSGCFHRARKRQCEQEVCGIAF